MRTTITLDPDVAARLEQLRDRDQRPFKQLVNDLLRAGLVGDDADSSPGGPYTTPRRLGTPRLSDLDDISDALTLAEGDAHR
ncbi:MAG: hypothetical protein WEB03_09520 [Nitriliruptor sp.]|uniref:hypothetical protein n=1 Tax=Nitriliruptor sp. TaxID=2448056 RepID=UPI0034A00A1B